MARQQRVREDPARKGLLFAGTEGSVYAIIQVMVMTGAAPLNLPLTSCVTSPFTAMI